MLSNIKKLNLTFLKAYQKFFSPLIGSFNLVFPVACKFYPTCSQYSQEAFRKHGTKKGFLLSVKRILHCHPFSKGGVDLP